MICNTCDQDLADYWLPSDCWWNKDKNIHRPIPLVSSYKLMSGYSDFDSFRITDCLSCWGPHDANIINHINTPMINYLEFSEELGQSFFMLGRLGIAIPLEQFYDVEPHDGSNRMPIDCRSCEHYLTSKCVVLRNAMDDVIFNSDLVQRKPETYQHVKNDVWHSAIRPCFNFTVNEESEFESIKSLYDFIDMMEAYCGIELGRDDDLLENKITNRHVFKPRTRDDYIPVDKLARK